MAKHCKARFRLLSSGLLSERRAWIRSKAPDSWQHEAQSKDIIGPCFCFWACEATDMQPAALIGSLEASVRPVHTSLIHLGSQWWLRQLLTCIALIYFCSRAAHHPRSRELRLGSNKGLTNHACHALPGFQCLR